MNIKRLFLAILLPMLFILPAVVFADFDSGSTGADGAFAPSVDTVLQLPESGVLNYTTVTIPEGVTVTFKKNSRNTPVTILATGDVTIGGVINLNGGDASNTIPGAGGPGGFDGGAGGIAKTNGNSGGGPGGGKGGGAVFEVHVGAGSGGGGGYLLAGSNGGTTPVDERVFTGTPGAGGAGGAAYGNERILPAIGGSGGGGGGGTDVYQTYPACSGGGGGGGGGSLVIASSGTIVVSGNITANGGGGAHGENLTFVGYPWSTYYAWSGGGGGGSGGSIRLLANTFSGDGILSAIGGAGGLGWVQVAGTGSVGRIRIEAEAVHRTAATTPPLSLGYPYAVIPPNMPSLKITLIGGISVPEVPAGSFSSPDVILPFNTQNPINITVTAANIPAGQTVTVTALSAGGLSSSATGALSGTEESSSMNTSLNIALAYPFLITATVTYELTAANIEDFYIDGEKVAKVKVVANMGRSSSVTYITESGKEIPATL